MITWHVETSAGPRFEYAEDEEEMRLQMIEYYNDTCRDETQDEELPEDATFDEAREAIEEYENFSYEEVYNGYQIDKKERDTVLAALRVYQHFLEGTTPDAAGIKEIAENDHHDPLGPEAIDKLCERLNV